MASFPQISPPTPCAHLYPPSYEPHALPVVKNVYRFLFRVLVFCRILIKRGFSQQIFKKYSNIKFDGYPPSGSQDVPRGRTDGQTDRHDKANSRFSKFCERA
jgi:hypothetical protein